MGRRLAPENAPPLGSSVVGVQELLILSKWWPFFIDLIHITIYDSVRSLWE